ncbi:hypothetical protein PVAP13_8NG312424 [Panicum virgatum]|uniref:Uncharacterized protein n=1 Tax=Panicum virgatum TaxID=38727 RepID=A0A8T0PBY9_PANVG|nr:hypothetical protein PVAP13_8NG312424 [Panicum virgatum]
MRQHMRSASSVTCPGRRKGRHACCLRCSASQCHVPLTAYTTSTVLILIVLRFLKPQSLLHPNTHELLKTKKQSSIL